ncbi:basic leucine zipper 4-like [Neltuma alba]|uniref:basic leucine zipper 4-like n=1 Tax=Neltuma alba TaxID=207710 RepID=UPI0010A48790|nr:basic leucine zipper 4-like [Prosopis alba]XP_028806897.1 basic leucine zipper 4-like [Prosopis alba]
MFFHDDVVRSLQFPSCTLQSLLTPGEVEELLSLIRGEDPASPSSGSQASTRALYSLDERRRRRMQSNRESARRSRWRKKKHLENLTSQVNRLKTENRELKNQLGFTLHQHVIVSLENAQLRSESEFLMSRLSHLYRALDTTLSP